MDPMSGKIVVFGVGRGIGGPGGTAELPASVGVGPIPGGCCLEIVSLSVEDDKARR